MKAADDKLDRYLEKAESVFKRIELVEEPPYGSKVASLVDQAYRYYADAKHFRSEEDAVSGLVCIAYCEGILDALRMLNLVRFSW